MGRFDALLRDSLPLFSWKNKWFRIAVFSLIFVMLLTLLIVLAVHHKGASAAIGPDIDDKLKYDCHPDQLETDENKLQANCKSRGCIWFDHNKNDTLIPKCFYPTDYVNYEVVSTVQWGRNQIVILNKTSKQSSGFANDVSQVKVEVTDLDDDKFRIKITDLDRTRWEPRLPILHLAQGKLNEDKKYDVKVADGILTATRRLGGALVFRTDLKKLIFADQFIQLITDVSSNSLYGLGENLEQHEKKVLAGDANDGRKRLKFLNYGDLPIRQKPGYGTHPFYLMYEDKQTDAHGVLLINSNPMDIILTHTPSVTYRTIGGILDLFIFMGPSPIEVIRQKTALIGHTPLPAYWALGFHLCRYGYMTDKDIYDIYHANIDKGVPFDGQWADINYMDQYNMFTYDRTNFSGLPDLVKHIQSSGRHFVIILDPAVSDSEPVGSEGYLAYKDGADMDIYIKNPSDEVLHSRIWNTKFSVLPDFTHPNAHIWWKKQLKIFHDKVAFDGLWTDMNEPAVFINGMEGGCVNDTQDRPQFNPIHPMVMENVTICMSAKHYIGPHYDVHNLYSLYEAKMTYEALTSIRNKRPFILSRATHTGQGVYSAHWLGDMDSSWDHLRMSIPLMLDFNLFGIPLVGADICGFVKSTTVEMCARWHSVGAFYPFCRNHNDIREFPQDPATMGGVVLEAAMKALNIRYTLLPYLYTLFFENSISGDPVLRSLKMNFPEDPNVASNDRQFMWGDSLLINAVLEENKTTMNAYLPKGLWYDWQSQAVKLSSGESVELSISLGDVKPMVRGGSVIPSTPAANHNSTSTQRALPFRLVAALDQESSASGQLYWDDGDSLDTLDFQEYSLAKFVVKESKFTSFPVVTGFKNPILLLDVQVWGVKEEPNEVRFTGADGKEKVLQKSKAEFSYKDNKVLTIKPFDQDAGESLYDLHQPFTFSWK